MHTELTVVSALWLLKITLANGSEVPEMSLGAKSLQRHQRKDNRTDQYTKMLDKLLLPALEIKLVIEEQQGKKQQNKTPISTWPYSFKLNLHSSEHVWITQCQALIDMLISALPERDCGWLEPEMHRWGSECCDCVSMTQEGSVEACGVTVEISAQTQW